MSKDTVFHEDIYNDLFITFGGLVSKKAIDQSDNELKPKELLAWNLIKHYVLKAVNTHDEVSERQPVLIGLFESLKLGQDLQPLQKEGDILLRDFIVEVKQPSFLKLSSIESSSTEGNDQQLIRAMRYRKRRWGILTNASEWQFVYESIDEHSNLFIPFISFSVLDMIRDEKIAAKQIKLFLSILLSRETRNHLIRETFDQKSRRTQGFANQLSLVIGKAKGLGISEENVNELIKFIFRLSFIFYCEDLGVLPRTERRYRLYDIRHAFSKTGKIDVALIKKTLSAFADQKWSSEKIKSSGNKDFFDKEIEKWLDSHSKLLQQINLPLLWFTAEQEELDLSDISSSDLCDVYQHCVTYGSENVGTVYTSKGLSNFINHLIGENIKKPLDAGDIVLDPACGSGHLLKRVLFICDRIVDPKKKFSNRQELIEYFCINHLAGIDKNETAVFITKINLWLTCAAKDKSLPVLTRFQSDNTLKRFENAYSKPDKQLSNFLGDLGSRVRIIVSNPPWSMIFGDHPEKWIATSEFWLKHKDKITRQDNTALSFGFMSHEILADDGVAVLILPGVFFVGSTAKLRDHLTPKIFAYAPQTRNTDFEKVDPSQNYGIIGFKKKPHEGQMRVYTDLDAGKLSSFLLPEDILFLPRDRKRLLGEDGADVFATNTLFPLFSSKSDSEEFLQLVKTTAPTILWDKGSKGKPIKGPELEGLAIPINASTTLFASPENRGNSKKILSLVGISKASFDKCSHKIIRLDISSFSQLHRKTVLEFLNSEMLNSVLGTLRTSKSIQSATLNILGLPDVSDTKPILLDKAEKLLKDVKSKRKKTA